MRVFVTGTGRCGTTTFAAACKQITNYTVGHETNTRKFHNLEYPDNHIEVDGHLQWQLAWLVQLYPDAVYVHLVRDREACVASLAKRQRSMASYAQLVDVPVDYEQIAEMFYRNQVATIDSLLPESRLVIRTQDMLDEFAGFCEHIGAEVGDMAAARRKLKRFHNAGAVT